MPGVDRSWDWDEAEGLLLRALSASGTAAQILTSVLPRRPVSGVGFGPSSPVLPGPPGAPLTADVPRPTSHSHREGTSRLGPVHCKQSFQRIL